MESLPIRLIPGQDLRRCLELVLADSQCQAAFVLSGIGSLTQASLRFAGVAEAGLIRGDLELLTLAGTVGVNGAHLHATVAGSDGAKVGGHVGYGCIVRTTAEVLLAQLREWKFLREADPTTGYDELVMRRR
jgi:predicted DNA-binding protein with PD1-like motif